MLKIIIPILLILVVFFIFRARKGMSKIDNIFNKENIKEMEDIKIKIQKRLDDNKTIK